MKPKRESAYAFMSRLALSGLVSGKDAGENRIEKHEFSQSYKNWEADKKARRAAKRERQAKKRGYSWD